MIDGYLSWLLGEVKSIPTNIKKIKNIYFPPLAEFLLGIFLSPSSLFIVKGLIQPFEQFNIFAIFSGVIVSILSFFFTTHGYYREEVYNKGLIK